MIRLVPSGARATVLAPFVNSSTRGYFTTAGFYTTGTPKVEDGAIARRRRASRSGSASTSRSAASGATSAEFRVDTDKNARVRGLGTTRLSLGAENFDDHVFERNGRAHRSAEIFEA